MNHNDEQVRKLVSMCRRTARNLWAEAERQRDAGDVDAAARFDKRAASAWARAERLESKRTENQS